MPAENSLLLRRNVASPTRRTPEHSGTMTATGQNQSHQACLALAENLLRDAGQLAFVAQGTSMLPAILPGDKVVVASVPFPEIQKGDVILFCRQERWFLHRVRQVCPGGQAHLITQGDAVPRPDPPVFPEQLLGRAVSVVSHGQPRTHWLTDSATQVMVRTAIRYLPFFAAVFLFSRGISSRLSNLRRFVPPLTRSKSSGAL